MNYAWANPSEFGGEDQHIAVNTRVIDNVLQDHHGAIATQFFPAWVGILASDVYVEIGSPAVTFNSTWNIFSLMLQPFLNAAGERVLEL